jgi:amino acid transporter
LRSEIGAQTWTQTHYATRWLDPALGFALGYNYWYSYAITLPTEITAAAIVISFWDEKTNPGVWITVFLVVILFINLCVKPCDYIAVVPGS